MRIFAGALIGLGLIPLSWMAFVQTDPIIAIPGIALAALWVLSVALRAPGVFHTAGLAATAFLCVVSVLLGIPVLVALFCLSSCLYGWDLALVDLRLGAHPRGSAHGIARKYVVRSLSLGLFGTVFALWARLVHVHLSFFSAFAISCLCIALFLLIHKRTQGLLSDTPAEEQRKADG